MKDYYSLLRVSSTASDAEIKQAFRRMAILLHPDKNPHPDAPLAFQEINEAYEVLGDVMKRTLYDQIMANEVSQSEIIVSPQTHRDPAYRRKKAGYKSAPSEPTAGYVLMMKLMPYTNWVSATALVISFFVWMDYALPRNVSDEVIVEWHRRLSHHIMITDKGHTFDLLYPQNLKFLREPELNIYTSKMFSFLDRIETKTSKHELRNLPSVFRNFMFGPVILLGLGLISQWLPKGEAKFSLAIATFIFILLNVMFILQSVW